MLVCLFQYNISMTSSLLKIISSGGTVVRNLKAGQCMRHMWLIFPGLVGVILRSLFRSGAFVLDMCS